MRLSLAGLNKIVVLLLIVVALSSIILAEPTGTQITYNYTETAPVASAASLTTAGGTFTTLVLNTTSQTMRWKAYVGNVTGTLTLDDADNNTIYDWSVTSVSGEVYASHNTGLDFSSVSCADNALINSENTFHNMTADQADSVNNTFNATAHSSFAVAGQIISADSCPSTALYVNDAPQTQSSSADFQEVLLKDNNGYLVYTSLINDDTVGFDGNTYDFQIIVAESDVKTSPTTYYFYVELDG